MRIRFVRGWLCEDRAPRRMTFGGSLVRNARFGDLALQLWRKSRIRRSFWRLGTSLLEEVSYETPVLETWRFTFVGSLARNARFGARNAWHLTFGGRLVRNARFGDLAFHFWRKSRTKRSFWRLGTSLLEVSYEQFVVHMYCGKGLFGAGLRSGQFAVQLQHGNFGDLALHSCRKPRTKRSFWRLVASLLFGGRLVRNARFGDLALHFWRKEFSYETLVLETWRFTFGGSLVRSARFGDLALHFWRQPRTKRSFWRLGASLLEEVLCEALVLETWRFTFGGSLGRNARSALQSWTRDTGRQPSVLAPSSKPSPLIASLLLVRFEDFGASLLEEVLYETLVLET